jgi:hypothetical protein
MNRDERQKPQPKMKKQHPNQQFRSRRNSHAPLGIGIKEEIAAERHYDRLTAFGTCAVRLKAAEVLAAGRANAVDVDHLFNAWMS